MTVCTWCIGAWLNLHFRRDPLVGIRLGFALVAGLSVAGDGTIFISRLISAQFIEMIMTIFTSPLNL